MSTAVLVKKLNKEMHELREEVRRMRAVFLHAVVDGEGEYKKTFVKKISARERETPRFRYAGKAVFLAHVRGK